MRILDKTWQYKLKKISMRAIDFINFIHFVHLLQTRRDC